MKLSVVVLCTLLSLCYAVKFAGFKKQQYIVDGRPNAIFNLFTDPTIQINARFCPGEVESRTVICELGFKSGYTYILVSTRKGHGGCHTEVKINGRELQQGDSEAWNGRTSGNITRIDKKRVFLQTRKLNMNMKFSMSQKKRLCLISLESQYKGVGGYPHGLLGQTARQTIWRLTKSYQGEGVIDGHWTDYELKSGDIFGDDFKFNKY